MCSDCAGMTATVLIISIGFPPSIWIQPRALVAGEGTGDAKEFLGFFGKRERLVFHELADPVNAHDASMLRQKLSYPTRNS